MGLTLNRGKKGLCVDLKTDEGEGQKIETSLFSTGMALQASGFLEIDRLDSELHKEMKEVLKTAREKEMKHSQIIDKFTEMQLRSEQPGSTRDIETVDCNHRPSDRQTFPYYRVYQVKDGFMSIAALTVKQRMSVCEVLGVEDKFAYIDLGNGNDETYFYQKEVMKKMEVCLGEKTKDEWIAVLEKTGVPCGPVNYGIDLFEDPHALEMNMVWSLDNPVSGPYKMMGNPMRFKKTPITPTKGAPVLGENTVEILKSIGYDDQQIESLKRQSIVK